MLAARLTSRLHALRRMVWLARHATYAADGLLTSHNADFTRDPAFARAYAMGRATGSWGSTELEWRAFVVCWAASQGLRLDGDFVECGVNRGGLAAAVVEYTGFASHPERTFYLLDSFEGFAPERRASAPGQNRDEYSECYEEVRATFAPVANVRLVRGFVPGTLPEVRSEHIAFMSIDMNDAVAERAALECFWDRLSLGAIVVLDDYGFSPEYLEQKEAVDEFARAAGTAVLSLPTGQGLLVK